MSFQQFITSLDQTNLYNLLEMYKKLHENPKLIEELDKEAKSKLLNIAVKFDVQFIIDLIIEFKGVLNPLESALIYGDVDAVEPLLRHGAKITDFEWDLSYLAKCIFDKKSKTCRKEMLLLLLKYGLDVKIRNEEGRNLLHLFIKYVDGENSQEALEVVEILINSGISVNESDKNGITPLHFCIQRAYIHLISFLIKNGADVKQKIYNQSPLVLAIMYGSKDICDLLISSGADIHARDNDGDTALHTACFVRKEESISLLISKGAEISAVNTGGKTPFYLLFYQAGQDFDENDVDKANFDSSLSVMVKEFAKLSFENIQISKIDMKLIRNNPKAKEIFEKCTKELQQMASTKFYGFYTYYSVMKMTKNLKKLAHLTKNEKFTSKFKKSLVGFPYYAVDLHRILEEATLLKKKFEASLSRLNFIFNDFLPDVVYRKMSENLKVEDLPLY